MAKKVQKTKRRQAPVVQLSGTRVCGICGESKPIANFSTIARHAAQGVDSRYCTYCFWLQLVVMQTSYEMEGGSIRIYLRPREKLGNVDLFQNVWDALPGWIENEDIVRRYSGIGSIQDQTAPFYQFYNDVKEKVVDKTPFPYGKRHAVLHQG